MTTTETTPTTNALLQNALDAIERARDEGALCNDAARAASAALRMEGDEAMLANRILSQGADPASLEYVKLGIVSEPIARAHTRGPASLEGEERMKWLIYATQSADESKAQHSTLRERVLRFANGIRWLITEPDATQRAAAYDHLNAIKLEPKIMAPIGGMVIPVYTRDIGFASAYWSGQDVAAVYCPAGGKDPESPYLAIGTSKAELPESVAACCDKRIAPAFQLVLHDEELIAHVGAALAEADLID